MPDPTTTTDADVAARLRRRADRAIAGIAGNVKTLAAAIRSARADIRAIGKQRELTTEARVERMDARRQQLQAVVDEVEVTVRDQEQQVETLAAAAWQENADPQEALLHESQLGRAWQRIASLLVAGQEAEEIAQRAADCADRIVFDALRAELPDYLRAAGRREPDIEGTIGMLDQIESPLLTEEQTVARHAVENAHRAVYLARVNIAAVRSGGVDTPILAGETRADSVDLSAEPVQQGAV